MAVGGPMGLQPRRSLPLPVRAGLLDAPPPQVRPGGAARSAGGGVEELLLPRQQPAPLGQGLLARTGDPRREPPPPAARHVRGAHRQAAGRTRHGDAPEAALRRPRLAGARVCGPLVHGPLVRPGAQQVRAAHREAARQPALAGALRDGVEVVSSVESREVEVVSGAAGGLAGVRGRRRGARVKGGRPACAPWRTCLPSHPRLTTAPCMRRGRHRMRQWQRTQH